MVSGNDYAVDALAAKFRKRRRRSRGIFAGIGAALLILGIWWLRRPLPPNEVAQRAADALAKHDVAVLLALTLPEERDKLNLTMNSVSGALNEGVYSHPLAARLTAKLEKCQPVDECIYYFRDPSAPDLAPIFVMIDETSDGHWWLDLGFLLYNASTMLSGDGGTFADKGHAWDALARAHGIRGVRSNVTGYSMVPVR